MEITLPIAATKQIRPPCFRFYRTLTCRCEVLNNFCYSLFSIECLNSSLSLWKFPLLHKMIATPLYASLPSTCNYV